MWNPGGNLLALGAQHAAERAHGDVAGRGGLAVGLLQFAVHLFAVHLDAAGCLDAQPHHVAAHVEHGDDDVVTDHHAFTGTSGQNEHKPLLRWAIGEQYPICRARRAESPLRPVQATAAMMGWRTGRPLWLRISWTARRLRWSSTIGAMRLA